MDIVGSRQTVVDVLEDLDYDEHPLRVVTSVAKAIPPCVLVALDSVKHSYSFGGEVVWRLYLMAPYTDDALVIDTLDGMLNLILPEFSPSADSEFVGVPTPEQSQPIPALLVRISHTV